MHNIFNSINQIERSVQHHVVVPSRYLAKFIDNNQILTDNLLQGLCTILGYQGLQFRILNKRVERILSKHSVQSPLAYSRMQESGGTEQCDHPETCE